MSINRVCACVASVWVAVLGVAAVHAQTNDVFAFIPAGGKTLLTEVAKTAPADEIRAILTGKHTRAEWESHLKGRTKAVPALGGLDETELATLADYLSFNMPLPANKLPTDLAKTNWKKVLPPDGRDFTLEYCQPCHIITVVVTQEKTQSAWLGMMNKPSHIEIELTKQQREALANYLVLNAAIPIDLVPEELRAGGASY